MYSSLCCAKRGTTSRGELKEGEGDIFLERVKWDLLIAKYLKFLRARVWPPAITSGQTNLAQAGFRLLIYLLTYFIRDIFFVFVQPCVCVCVSSRCWLFWLYMLKCPTIVVYVWLYMFLCPTFIDNVWPYMFICPTVVVFLRLCLCFSSDCCCLCPTFGCPIVVHAYVRLFLFSLRF